jgi:hypothetical protein
VASASTTVGCSVDAVQVALGAGGSYTFASACAIDLTEPLTMTGGTVTLNGNGSTVDFSGGVSTQLFSVTGGSLTLEDVTLTGGTAQGTNGTDSTSNGNGGDAGQGGAMTISAGATVDLVSDTVEDNDAYGGNGGNGGCGCNVSNAAGVQGGNGATGAAGEDGAIYNLGTLTADTTTFSGNYAYGGEGGAAGAGGGGVDMAAGSSGEGADAGPAQGGSIWNGGTLTITSSSFSAGGADGGYGGNGAIGGYTGTDVPGGGPYQAGNGGPGGDGATGDGGAIYDVGSMTVTNTSFDYLSAVGGSGGDGGALGLSDVYGVDDGSPGAGGNGGDALHGAVDSTASLGGDQLGCGNTATAGQGGTPGEGTTGDTATAGQAGTAADPDDGADCRPTVASVAPDSGTVSGELRSSSPAPTSPGRPAWCSRGWASPFPPHPSASSPTTCSTPSPLPCRAGTRAAARPSPT